MAKDKKKIKARAPKKNNRQQTSLMQIALGTVVVLALAYVGLVFSTPLPPRVPVGLPPISLPTDPKYKAVLRDEKKRAELLNRQRTEEEEKQYKEGYEKNQFNQWISDQLSLHRRAYDTRQVDCLKKKYLPVEHLPTVSVIIIFYNEARSTLLRTVHSVLDRTHPTLLKEIILVDDKSSMKHLGYALEQEVKGIPKTKLLRLKQRSGLIRAKVHGASAARGEVILFLDSHCEVNDGYLEPLLDPIARNRKTVAMPIIDAIDFETWEHRTGLLERGIFDWTLTFKWKRLTQQDEYERRADPLAPFASPAMAGGLFAMDKKFFFEIGAYDMGMDTWGGENIEMSIRIWTCGGRIEAVPCSHVGHVFRQKAPYKFKDKDPLKTIGRNLNRVAEVWMDRHADLYYAKTGNRDLGAGDRVELKERVQFRQQHQCKSFEWYLEHVYPDMEMPEELLVRNGTAFPWLACAKDPRPWYEQI
eukprot:TRINITY_DN10074_c0_g5_i1.p1 TRINITY_DN10074_c0_g5~~TRINITY_DN10074_c0_g5_i1.p1  ORF type:complete len:473 (+),score=128.13 TRINITY_DN10074_c0_g5_i1:95-1513(+)